jgi:hypothetical protein
MTVDPSQRKKTNIGSHIIPRFYLEQFAIRLKGRKKPGRLWVYESSKTPNERATTVQGLENGYFGYMRMDGTIEGTMEIAFEKHLASKENECNDVLVCAKSFLYHWPPGSQEKMAFYLGLLYARSTQRRCFTEKVWLQMQNDIELALGDEKYLSALASELNIKHNIKHNKAMSGDDIRKAALAAIERARTRSALKNAFLFNLLLVADTLARTLIKKNWQVWYAPEASEFVTSDNPLVSFQVLQSGGLSVGEGFAKGGVIAAFPLAPSACLVIGPHGQSRTVDKEAVSQVNEAVIRLCNRYVYSKTLSKDIQMMVDRYAGNVRYGINAFLPPGPRAPSAGRDYLLRLLDLKS